MLYRLISIEGEQTFELRPGVSLVVGRAMNSDLPVFDPTISRRHAELSCGEQGVDVRDLGSSNGTFVNGKRIEQGRLAPGDIVTFGKVAFRLKESTPTPPAAASSSPGMTKAPAPRASATIVRPLPFSAATPSGLGGSLSPSGTLRGSEVVEAAIRGDDRDQAHARLQLLLEVSKRLGKAADVDTLLDRIAAYCFDILEVDRVAIQLGESVGALVTKVARDRLGAAPVTVPQSIARLAVEEQSAVMTDDAGEDQRFGGQSILIQRVRSAMCIPLVGSEARPLGVLYVDNSSLANRFGESELDFLIAFAGIAAVAIENGQFAERIRRETLARSNFERYFTPGLAAQIADAAGAVRLGGEKRPVAVLFSDIRGFTALSETMKPDDMASLLTEYFTEMVECVFRNGGTLDKFIGDAVMAQWGAPIASDEDPDRAMRAAIEMMRALEELNARWRLTGRPELEIGIGLNYGEAFAGNIGSERRLEFTVIGDTVNTANRLCGVAGAGEVLLTEAMRQALHDPPALEPRPPVDLRGKSQFVPVYSARW